MNPNRQYQGRKNRALGEIFETRIGHSLDRYAAQGVAYIQKTPEPFKVIKSLGGGRFEGYYEKKGQPDFKGILCDGSTIIFEAKHTDNDRIQQSAVTETQTEYFDKYQSLGARCYVMVSMRLQDFYRIPWDVWKGMKEIFGHKYMTPEEMKEFKLKEINGRIQILDGIELREEIKDEATEG
jgi:recombination protein U